MKKFFKSPMAIFIGIGTLLNLSVISLLLAGSIGLISFMSLFSAVSLGVFGLYQFYIKEAIIKEANGMIISYDKAYKSNLDKLNEELAKNENLQLRVKFLTTMSESNAKTEKVELTENIEVLAPTEISKPKRKYNKRKKA
tara:strand:+ start:4909 stop:5328 length:420 start_codon:yes stop_codon:yes gene_type:complete